MTHSAKTWVERKKVAEDVCDRGGGFEKIGEEWGTSRIYAYRETRRRWPDLYSRILDRPHKNATSPSEAVRRCRAIANRKTSISSVARALGLSRPALTQWLNRNAPDGPQSLLEDYEDHWRISV